STDAAGQHGQIDRLFQQGDPTPFRGRLGGMAEAICAGGGRAKGTAIVPHDALEHALSSFSRAGGEVGLSDTNRSSSGGNRTGDPMVPNRSQRPASRHAERTGPDLSAAR